MKDRKGKSANKKGALHIVGKGQQAAMTQYLAQGSQMLLPLLELVEDARASIDELMMEAARGFVEQLLVLSAQEVAGCRHPGREKEDVRWHGKQQGRIVLAERKLSITRPRLRAKGMCAKEVAIPAYERLKDDARLGQRMADILVTGVSTRKYGKVLPEMAGTVGIAKSSVSRRFVEASAAQLKELMEKRFDNVDLLAIYLDGIVVDKHHILAAIGVDEAGSKHLLGLARGASENAQVVKDLP